MEKVLITGVSSSICESIAIKLSSKYIIILSGKNLDYLNQVKNKLNGRDHQIWVCDLLIDSISDSFVKFLIENKIKPNHFLHLGGSFTTSPLRLIKKIKAITNKTKPKIITCSFFIIILELRSF
jgi:hypothetical protein